MNDKNTKSIYVPIVIIKQVRQKTVSYNECVRTPDSIVKMLSPIFRDLDREQFAVVGLNAQNKPNVVNVVSIGSLNSAQVSSREVFKPLILSNCLAFICAHNHVGGTLEPSFQDKQITKVLFDVGVKMEIRLLDHIILGLDGKYYSFSRSGIMPTDGKGYSDGA